ncbi:MAG TPA: NUDIX hydrolase N-terminal domain-containing protein [Steroidobacteraceae bacterium]|nr:NUDIX hydrolase N-terminal domain-containing protein [Steroidobacteraceae bacterium]
MEDRWLGWSKRLQAIASTGLHYAQEPFDRERYAEVGAIANEMLAALADVPPNRILGLVPEFAKAYATPLVEVRAAVFDRGRILLVREASDGLWTLPGGFADVGRSPRENVVKEVREEASVRVDAKALYAVRHKARHDYDADTRDFYKLFFLCERLDDRPPRPGVETTAADFFAAHAVPPLSTGRTLPADVAAAFAYAGDPTRPVEID